MPDQPRQPPRRRRRPGRSALRRSLLRTYRRLPTPARLAVIRLVAPSHTVGSLCLIEHDGRLLMLRQHHREGWTLPGGLVDRGEDAAQAAVREVLEETGLQVEVGLPIGVVVDPDTRRVDVLFHVPVDEAVTVRPRSEASRASWLAPQQAGPLDAPTSQAVAVLGRSRETGVYRGHLTRRPG